MTPESKSKLIVEGSSLGSGLILGGITRKSALASTIALYAGLIGGTVGQFMTHGHVKSVMEGVAGGTAGIFGLGVATKGSIITKQIVSPANKGVRKLIKTQNQDKTPVSSGFSSVDLLAEES